MLKTKFIVFLFLLCFYCCNATTFTDINVKDEVSIKENAIVCFIDRTNCLSSDLGLKELIIESKKRKLKPFLVVVGNSCLVAQEYAKSKDIVMLCLDDSQNYYTNEFKVKSTPAFFTVNFLGRVQKMGLIGKSDSEYLPLLPNRISLPDLSISSDYFYTFSVASNIFTYNATNNSIIKLDHSGKTLSKYSIDDQLKVIRNMFYYDKQLVCVEYSPQKGTSVLTLDSNLEKTKLTDIKIEDSSYMSDFSLGMHSIIDNEGFLYSAVRKYSDTSNSKLDILKCNISNGNIVNSYFSGDTTVHTDLIIVKSIDNNLEYLDESKPRKIFKFIGSKLETKNISIEPIYEPDHYLLDVINANNKYFLVVGTLEDGYGSMSSRINYYIYTTDDSFKLLYKSNLYKAYNNGPFIFLRLKNDRSFEILGKDDYGCFIETIDF